MLESVINNRQIAKNTIFLYLRMAFVMIIGLYTVRAFLDILGPSDYGLYNVVGGVVSMLSFLNSTLAVASQRYFSIALVQKNQKRLHDVFCLNQTVFVGIIILCVAILESLGLWFVNYQMIIPADRIYAINVVYQISIISIVPQMLSVSYYALVVARERMQTYAIIGIIDAVLRLSYVFILKSTTFDKLIFFSTLIMISQFIILGIYMVVCKSKYKESRFHFLWDKKETLEILGFSSWHLLGTVSVVIRSNGINLLINMFFNPIVNAGRAIAFQINNSITQFTQSFFKAVLPQIYKSYANNEIEKLNVLIMRSTIICFFLTSLFSIPLYLNADFILDLWLANPPTYALQFTQLVLINCLVDSVADCTIAPALATGKIKTFYLIIGGLYILTLPIAYICLRLGLEPTSTMFVSILISILSTIARAWFLIDLIEFPMKKYLFLLIRLFMGTAFIGAGAYAFSMFIHDQWAFLVISSFVVVVLQCIVYMIFICSKQDRLVIKAMIRSKLHLNC